MQSVNLMKTNLRLTAAILIPEAAVCELLEIPFIYRDK